VPGELLVAGVVDGVVEQAFGLGDEADQGVESDAGVAEPVGGAQRGEGVDCVVEDLEAVIVDAWCGQVVGWDKVEFAAVMMRPGRCW
jgi:hypothetical protein